MADSTSLEEDGDELAGGCIIALNCFEQNALAKGQVAGKGVGKRKRKRAGGEDEEHIVSA